MVLTQLTRFVDVDSVFNLLLLGLEFGHFMFFVTYCNKYPLTCHAVNEMDHFMFWKLSLLCFLITFESIVFRSLGQHLFKVNVKAKASIPFKNFISMVV